MIGGSVQTVECGYCHDRVLPLQIVEIAERKRGQVTGRKFRLCFNCYKAYLSLEVKDLPIKDNIKASIERWRKDSPVLN